MKKLYLVVLFLIVICTGCKAEYNLTINEDLSIHEEIIALEDKDFYNQYPKSSVSRVIDLVMSRDNAYLEEKQYNVEKIISEESGVKISKSYDSIDDYYSNSEFYKQLLSSFEYKKNGDVVIFNAKGAISREENLIDKYVIAEAKINIKVPFRVLKNNADDYDSTTNTYTWNVTSDTDYKEIYLEFDTTKEPLDVRGIVAYIIFGVIVVGIGCLGFYFKKKSEKSNEI